MAQFASATFTGTDATELTAHDAAWTRRPTSATNSQLVGNRLRASGVNPSEYYHSGTPASADYTVEADIYVASLVAGVSAGVFGRGSTDGNNSYSANYHVGTGWRLYKQVGGTFTLLTSVAATLTALSTYRLKLSMIGTAIKVFADGVQVLSVTDSAVSAAGKAGIRIYDNASTPGDAKNFHLDNFSADDPSSGSLTLTGSPSVIPNSSSTGALPAPIVTTGSPTTISGTSTGGALSVATGLLASPSVIPNSSSTGAISIGATAAYGKVNVGGSWKTVSAVQVNVGGVWKTVTAVKVNVSGSWKSLT